jgi:hypothetical protein
MIQAAFIFSIALLSFVDDGDQLLERIKVRRRASRFNELSSRSRRRRSLRGIESWQSLKSASIIIRVAVSTRLVLPGTLPRIALTSERSQVGINLPSIILPHNRTA